MRAFLLITIVGVVSMSTLVADDSPPRKGEVKLTEEALSIQREAILIDGHNDLPWKYREKHDPGLTRIDITKPVPDLHTDIPRLRKGGVGAQFWSAYVDAD